jgi:hypothetical protein
MVFGPAQTRVSVYLDEQFFFVLNGIVGGARNAGPV